MQNKQTILLKIEKLAVHFPYVDLPAFENVSFEVPEGSIFGIFGETGCGKTTLARCLTGFIEPACITGNIYFRSRDTWLQIARKDEAFFRGHMRGQGIVYVPQDPYKTLNPYDTVREQLLRILRFYGDQRTPESLLQKVEFPVAMAGEYPHALSAGQRQRAMVALALAVSPRIIIFDEPTASVDKQGREALWHNFSLLRDAGCTILVISHEIFDYQTLIPASLRFYFSKTQEQAAPPVKLKDNAKGECILALQNIHKSFHGVTILEDINLDIHKNEWVYLEGSNGSGKSTLVNILSGIMTADKGKITWHGQTNTPANSYRRWVHPVFQDHFDSLNPRLRIRQSIAEVINKAPLDYQSRLKEIGRHLWIRLELSQALWGRFS